MNWLDPDHLPSVSGDIERFVVNPRSEAVRVYGVRPKATMMLSAVAIETIAGDRIIDTGPPHAKEIEATPKRPQHPHQR
jgi:hypothetical protein